MKTAQRIGLGVVALAAILLVSPARTTEAQSTCQFDAALDVGGETSSITITEGDTVDFRLRALNVVDCLDGWRHNFDYDSNINDGWDKNGGNIPSTQNSGSFTYTTPGTYIVKGEIRNGKASQGDPITTKSSNNLTVIVEEDTPPPPPACDRDVDIQPTSGVWNPIGTGSKINFSGTSASVSFKNVSTNPNCDHDVRLASYEVFDESSSPNYITTQELFKQTHINIKPGETKTLSVAIPTCRTQVDLFEGPSAPTTNPDFANLPAYRLYDAEAKEGTGSCTPVVQPDPAICTALTINPGTIEQGDSATLAWATQNVNFAEGDTVVINQGVGQKNTANGSQSIAPIESKTYTLTVTDNGGQVTTCSDNIVVNPPENPKPVCDVYFENVVQGQTTTGDLVWTSENVTAASFNQGLGAQPTNGTIADVTVSQTTTYTGTFTGPYGSVTCSDTLTVVPQEQKTDIAIAKLVDGVKKSTGIVNTEFEYTLSFINYGPIAAANVVITDVPTPGGIVTDYQLEDAPNDANCTIQQTGTVLTCQLGTLNVNETGSITYTVVGTKPGTVDNTATIETTTPETDYTNNEDDAQVVVYSSEYADITIEKYVRNADDNSNGKSASGELDDYFIYTLEYRNAGSLAAANVTIDDTFSRTDRLTNIQILTESEPNGCTVKANDEGITCDVGTLLVGESGTITYRADADAVGSVDNTVVIDTTTPEEPAPDGILPNEDDARVTISNEEEGLADASIDKSVSPGSGDPDTVFTYTLVYKHVSGPTVLNVELDDTPDKGGYLEDFNIVSTPSGVTCDIKPDDEGIRCDVGDVAPGDEGTIVYTAKGIKIGTVDNEVVLTGDNDSDPDNNKDDATVRIQDGGCSGNCGGGRRGGGGGGGRISDPDVVLFERPQPQVLGTVALNQVPYTGVGDVLLVILFFAGLLGAAGFITYVVLKRRKTAATAPIMPESFDDAVDTGTVHIERSAAPVAREAYKPVAPKIPGMVESTPVPTPVARTTEAPVNIPTEDAPRGSDIYETLDTAATAHKALLSGEAKRMLIAQAENDPAQIAPLLDSVVASAKERFPREDGWLLLNQSRVAQLLTSQGLSTIPLFIGWMVNRNEKQLFNFLRNLSNEGKAPEHFIRQVIAELDVVYQARLDNVTPQTDPEIVDQLKSVEARELESIITALARSLDGRYSSPLDGVKVALTRIMSTTEQPHASVDQKIEQ